MDKERLDAAYRRVTGPLARRRDGGLAAAALGALFGEGPRPDEAARLAPVEALRARIAAGAGGEVVLQRQRIGRLPRTGAELASRSSIPACWGLFLHRLATSVEATRILELGSCGGVSGAYLATAPSCERFVGVEGSPALATAAGEALATLHPGAIVLEGLFEERLDDAVAALGGRVELVFVDGERRAEGLTELVRRLQPVLGEEGTLAVDDVQVTREFHRAWRQATAGHWSLDLGRMGISSARPGPARSLAPLTGIWLARKPLPTV